jgi:hypothetical protein
MNTIETHVLELIGENIDSPDVFVDTSVGMDPIRASINDAIEEISMLTGCFVQKYYVALRQERTFYRFDLTSGTVGWILDVWLVNQKRRLEQTSYIKLMANNPRWLYNTGSPESYFPIGLDYFGIWPRPSSDTDILDFNVVLIPARYSEDTDRIKLRDDLQWAAAHYATGEYWASRGDAASAIYHHNKYLQRVGLDVQYPMATEKVYVQHTDKEYMPKATG